MIFYDAFAAKLALPKETIRLLYGGKQMDALSANMSVRFMSNAFHFCLKLNV